MRLFPHLLPLVSVISLTVIATAAEPTSAEDPLVSTEERNFYEDLIPSPIKTSAPFIIDGQAYLFRGGCGVASFWLSDSTLNEIKQKGLSFFANATKASRLTWAKGETHKEDFFYDKWQPTPMPTDTFSDGWWPAFECTKALSDEWKKRIVKAAQSPGSYYTYKKGDLLVLPELKIVILIYFK
jgi:hypothetical protein